jgi:DNA-binding response OmpR family regulator
MNTNILLIEDEASIADNISYALQTKNFLKFLFFF